MRNFVAGCIMATAAVGMLASCAEKQDFDENDAMHIEVAHISADMAKVRDYAPLYAVVAHRGTTYWAPEETEAACGGRVKWEQTIWSQTFSRRKTV